MNWFKQKHAHSWVEKARYYTALSSNGAHSGNFKQLITPDHFSKEKQWRMGTA